MNRITHTIIVALHRLRRHLRILPLVLVVTFGFTSIALTLFMRGRMLMEEQIDLRLISTASVAARQFDAAALDRIRGNEFVHTDTLLEVAQKLDDVRLGVPNIKSASILRPTSIPGVMEYVADARLAWPLTEIDANGNGVIEEGEEQVFPGDKVQIFGIEAFRENVFDRPVISRPLGNYGQGVPVIAYAPIRKSNNELTAVLAIGMDGGEYAVLANNTVTPMILTLLLLFALLIGGYVGLFFFKRRAEIVERMEREQLAKQELSAHQLGAAYSIIRRLHELGCIQPANSGYGRDKVEESVDRIGTIVDDLSGSHDFAFTKIARGTHEPVSVAKIIDGVVDRMKTRLARHAITVDKQLDQDVHLRFDAQLLKGMVREILDNAVYYSSDGSRISINARQKGGYVEVSISDTGSGISERDMERVFERFVRGGNAPKYHPDGLGLGLHICKQLCDLTGGTLTVESQQDQGTTVTFTLPLDT